MKTNFKLLIIIFICIFTLSSFNLNLFSQENNIETSEFKPVLLLSYQMGITAIPQVGDETEYLQGINSFPVIPSHTVKTVSSEVSLRIYKNFHIAFTLDYSMNTKLRVTDPSDGDSFVFETLSFYNYYLNFRYRIKLFGLKTYFSIGAGKNYTNGAKEENIRTEKGYTVLLNKSEPYSQWLLIANMGIDLNLSGGLCLTGKISILNLTEDKVKYLQFLAGLKFTVLNRGK